MSLASADAGGVDGDRWEWVWVSLRFMFGEVDDANLRRSVFKTISV